MLDTDALLHGELLDPGLPAAIGPNNVEILVNRYQRYESTFHHKLHKNLHALERLQRMRMGDKVAAPESVDITLQVISASPEVPTGTAPCLLEEDQLDASNSASSPEEGRIATSIGPRSGLGPDGDDTADASEQPRSDSK